MAELLARGVPIEIADERQQRTLHVAAARNALEVARLLIERGAEIDPRETAGTTPIGFASHNDHLAMLDLLSRTAETSWTLALSRLCRSAANRCYDADPSGAVEVSADGLTPLFWLPSNDADAIEVVDLLLAHGVDPAYLSPRGLTAAVVARRRGLDGAADRLERAAGALPAPDADSGPKPGLDHYDALAARGESRL